MEWKSGVGFEFFVEGEEDFGVVDAGDFCAVEKASGDDVEDLAGLGAEDAGEVCGLVAGEGGSGRRPVVGDPATAGHVFSSLLSGLRDEGVVVGVERDLLRGLVVEVDGGVGGFATGPGVLVDGEVEDDHAFSGLAGWDGDVAVEGRGY